ncbi:MAG: L-rhamnose mutarotase [Puniceicoccaceae bacterium]
MSAVSEAKKIKRFCKVIGIKPEKREEYLELHRNIWPEVRENIRKANIRNYSLFVRGDLLIQYYEYHGHDLEADIDRDANSEIKAKWEALCVPCQQPMHDSLPEEWWSDMEEVMHFD